MQHAVPKLINSKQTPDNPYRQILTLNTKSYIIILAQFLYRRSSSADIQYLGGGYHNYQYR